MDLNGEAIKSDTNSSDMRIRLLLTLAIASTSLLANDSTSHYFISFKDKNNSLYSTEKPWEYLSVKSIDRRQKFGISITENDLPVNSSYIQAIDILRGVRVVQASRWLNGVEVILDKTAILDDIRHQSFVSGIQFLGTIKKRNKDIAEEIDSEYYKRSEKLAAVKSAHSHISDDIAERVYNESYEELYMIGLPDLHKQGFMGEKMSIAVLDAGFFNAYKVRGMEDLLQPGTVIKDFVDGDNSVWEDDAHGAKVLSFMKTYNPSEYIGSAPYADYMLLRTEIASQEYPLEELKWVFAAEFADSSGADMIIASVGYHTFDDRALNHSYKELDGSTTIIARGANIANATGMAVVCSAGNEGQGKWRKIGTPADATGVFAIGACDSEGKRAYFSSEGINNGRIKPDFTAPGQRVTIASHNGFYAGNGTSYATPVFAGALACLMQAFPLMTPDSLKVLLKYSASHFTLPDTLMGYGIPDMYLAYVKKQGTTFEDDFTPVSAAITLERYTTVIMKSSSEQKVKISVLYKEKKRFKKISSKTYHLKKGEWLRDEQWLNIIRTETRRKNKRDVMKCILEIQTEKETKKRYFVS
ncbi:MAG: S8 family serine peptidase [Chitinophagaceae bacterium]